MYIRRPALLLPFALLACTGRPLDGTTETGAGSTTGTGATDPSGPTGPGTPDPTGTSAPTTGPGTPDPIDTTGPGTTEAVSTAEVTTDALTGSSTTGPVDPSGTSSTSDTGMDPLEPPGWPPGLMGCNQVAPAGTQVSGQTAFGPFAAARAYFGILHSGAPYSPVLLFLSDEADAAAELAMPDGKTGAILNGNVWSGALTEGEWLGTWPYKGVVLDGDEFANPNDLTVTLGFAGNWDAHDPNDPPRVTGTLDGTISGPFDAVYCNKLNIEVIPE